MNRDLRGEYLSAMGLTQWKSRLPRAGAPYAAIETAPISDAMPVQPVFAPAVELLDWSRLRETVASCQRCALAATRTQTVFGVGNQAAEWLIVGEAPGAEEDRQGLPFVGRAGQMLDAMLRAIGLAREQVYIANVMKCRPPGNRDPRPDEANCCLPYLERQIELIKPKVMLAVGRIAAQNLLKTDTAVSRLRQRVHRFGRAGVPLVVTYHPAYLRISARRGRICCLLARCTPVATASDIFGLASVDIRPMLDIDVSVVVQIERSSYQFPWSEGIFRDCLRVGYVCRVIDVANDIVGHAIMSMGAGEAHILNVCVREDFRCRGLGRTAMQHLLERARNSGMQDAYLEVRPTNTNAIRLYQSLGFERVGTRRGYYQAVGGREDAAVLRRRLAAEAV
jgi:uracil-DNA glycosylase